VNPFPVPMRERLSRDIWEEDIITQREMKILCAAINKYNLPLSPSNRNIIIRARIMKAIITAIMDFEARKGGEKNNDV
jgi:transcriptional regulator CtsR